MLRKQDRSHKNCVRRINRRSRPEEPPKTTCRLNKPPKQAHGKPRAEEGGRPFSSYCDEWLAVNRPRLKESTCIKYRSILEVHIKPALGTRSPKDLSPLRIEAFTRFLLEEKQLSAKTVKDILSVLHSITLYAAKQSRGRIAPAEIVYPKTPKREMRVLSREEQTEFVRFLSEESDPCKFGILLALLTGLRIGEICALQWKNISPKTKTVKIESTMQRLRTSENNCERKTHILVSDPKSTSSARIIPLSEYAASLCEQHFCHNPEAYILTDTPRFMEPRTLQYRLKKYAQACNLQDVHFHTLRHTFATRCVEVDFEIKSLSEILGHASPRITLERYVHSSLELKRTNMNKLSALGF